MIHRPHASLSALVITPLAAALALSGCATAPPAAHPAAPAPGPAWAVPGAGRMAPIPNPEPKEGREPREPRERAAHPVAAEHAAPPAVVAAVPAHPAPAAPQAQMSNAARAAHLRAAGLEQMNRGAIDKAVNLLQQALTLDPGNALIRRDLDRAIRISHAVHQKK